MFSILKEHKGFGKQILLLAKDELIKTYKGAVIGPLWAFVKPAFTIFVYWFAFSCGIKQLRNLDINVETGVFGSDMTVNITNDGPVTIIIDSESDF